MGYDKGQILYRAKIRTGSNYVEYDEYLVMRSTPKGGWVRRCYGEAHQPRYAEDTKDRFVLVGGRWCSPTKEKALERLRRRNARYVTLSRRQLREAERRAQLLAGEPVELPALRVASSGLFGRDL